MSSLRVLTVCMVIGIVTVSAVGDGEYVESKFFFDIVFTMLHRKLETPRLLALDSIINYLPITHMYRL